MATYGRIAWINQAVTQATQATLKWDAYYNLHYFVKLYIPYTCAQSIDAYSVYTA